MKKDIDKVSRKRFIPHIHLYEFEGLLFSDLDVYREIYEDEDFLNYDYLVETGRDFENPEMIDEGKNTAPSARLKKEIFKNYDKIVDGLFIAKAIGLEKIRSKCPGFNAWINNLSKILLFRKNKT